MASMPTNSLFHLLIILGTLAAAEAVTFTVTNQCTYTVWPAATPVGGGTKLDQGQSWTFDVPTGTASGRVWGRTGCSFDDSGRGTCTTGDCGGVLACTLSGRPPMTIAEFTLNRDSNQDYFDLSLIDGFNVPMNFLPAGDGAGCSKGGARCSADVTAACPEKLKTPGGCNSACTVFNTDTYCCRGQFEHNCPPTDYSKFFKGQCPDAYSYAKDDQTSTFTCPVGTNYQIVFCPA